jgi:hypothetical protein
MCIKKSLLRHHFLHSKRAMSLRPQHVHIICVILFFSTFLCRGWAGDVSLAEAETEASIPTLPLYANPLLQCETAFPTPGDILPLNDPVYSVITCHVSPEVLEKLIINDHRCVVNVSLVGYVNGPERQAILALFQLQTIPIHSHRSPASLVLSFSFSGVASYFAGSVPTRLKIIYSISIGAEFVGQTSTVIYLTDLSQELLETILQSKGLALPSSFDPSQLQKTYDFIEIGTSSFDTLIEKAYNNQSGLSIEPLACHQNLLPNKPNVIKVNAGIDSRRAETEEELRSVVLCSLYYLDPEYIQLYISNAEDEQMRYLNGLSSFGSIQPAVLAYELLLYGHKRAAVPFLSLAQVLFQYQIRAVHVLKLDCEGHDAGILLSYLDFVSRYSLELPCVIQYESIVHASNREELGEVMQTLLSKDLDFAVYSFSYATGDRYAVRKTCSLEEISALSNLLTPDFLLMLSACRDDAHDWSSACCTVGSADYDVGEYADLPKEECIFVQHI